jgi:hypothetical protein
MSLIKRAQQSCVELSKMKRKEGKSEQAQNGNIFLVPAELGTWKAKVLGIAANRLLRSTNSHSHRGKDILQN